MQSALQVLLLNTPAIGLPRLKVNAPPLIWALAVNYLLMKRRQVFIERRLGFVHSIRAKITETIMEFLLLKQ